MTSKTVVDDWLSSAPSRPYSAVAIDHKAASSATTLALSPPPPPPPPRGRFCGQRLDQSTVYGVEI
jgi:hypothetical protein